MKKMGFNEPAFRRTKFGNCPVVYRGVQFKSKLEGRIACMLDHWVKWEMIDDWAYEPEKLIMQNIDKHGKRKDVEYIYDFYVEGYEGEDWIFEVKGAMSAYDLLKWELVKRDYDDKLCVLFAGNLMPKRKVALMGQKKKKRKSKYAMSQQKYDKMHRIVDRVWENLNTEFKRECYLFPEELRL